MLLSPSLHPHLNSRCLSFAPSPAEAYREQQEVTLTKVMSSPTGPWSSWRGANPQQAQIGPQPQQRAG